MSAAPIIIDARQQIEIETLARECNRKRLEFPAKYEILRKIAEGGQSAIFEIARKTDNKRFALKVSDESSYYSIVYEGVLLKSLKDHVPYVARCIDSLPRHEKNGEVSWSLVLPLFERDLYREYIDPLQQRKKIAFTDLLSISKQGLYALRKFETRTPSIVHKDLNPPNMYFNSRGVLTIADFGISVENSKTLTGGDGCCRPAYQPPEDSMKLPYDGSVDVWGLGLSCIELAMGSPLLSSAMQDPVKRIKNLAEYLGPIPDEWYKTSDVAKDKLTPAMFPLPLSEAPLSNYLMSKIKESFDLPLPVAKLVAKHFCGMVQYRGKDRIRPAQGLADKVYSPYLYLEVHRHPQAKKTKPNKCWILPAVRKGTREHPILEADLSAYRYWHKLFRRTPDNLYTVRTLDKDGHFQEETHRFEQDARLLVNNGKITIAPLFDSTKEEGKEASKDDSKKSDGS